MELTKTCEFLLWVFVYFTLVITYHHENTGHKNQTEDEISNGQADKIIEPQEQLSGSLTTPEFTKKTFKLLLLESRYDGAFCKYS